MARKKIIYYKVPDNYWFRIHFVRPRFKGNIENVLLYMANEWCRIPKCSCEEYNKKNFNAIKMFPGNIDMADRLHTIGVLKYLHYSAFIKRIKKMMLLKHQKWHSFSMSIKI